VSWPTEICFGVRCASKVVRLSSVTSPYRRALPTLAAYLDERIVRWRTGTSEGQVAVVLALGALSALLLIGSLVSYNTFPAATFVIPLLLGTMTLRYRPLLTLVLVIVVSTRASRASRRGGSARS
jgi:hypothetical protein